MDDGIMTEEELRELTTLDYIIKKYRQKLIQKNKIIIEGNETLIENNEIIMEQNKKIIKNNNLMNEILLRENGYLYHEINRLEEENRELELENEN